MLHAPEVVTASVIITPSFGVMTHSASASMLLSLSSPVMSAKAL